MQFRAAPYLFVAPFVLLFAAFMLYPLARSLILSFFKTAGPGYELFVGFDNYRFLLLDRQFWWAVANTVGFAVVFVALQVPLSLGLALLLNDARLKWRGLFRFAFFSTYLVGPVFAAVLFGAVFRRDGLVNRVVGLVAGGVSPDWTNDPRLAMPTVLVAALWLSVGFGMIYLLAALQSVDHQQYDAAAVDGAGAWARFWHVTLPGVRHVLVLLVLVGTIASLQLFELPYVLFQGPGPRNSALTIVMYLFLAFFSGDLGYASAVGWVLVLMLLGVAWLQLRLFGAAGERRV
ncbi:MAG: carbohydrate ABC transporter permease [Tepidisphaeraceae bacterium]